jgi:hypothetical protein
MNLGLCTETNLRWNRPFSCAHSLCMTES